MGALYNLTVALMLSASAGAGNVSGRVISFEGRPLAGAEVALYASESSEDRAARLVSSGARPLLGRTTSGADGTFRIDAAVTAGLVEVRATGYAPSALTAFWGERLTVELKPAKPRKGVVRHRGQPVVGATLVWTGPADPGGSVAEHVVKSDAQGSYEIPDPDAWAGAVVVLHPDFAMLFAGGEAMRWPSPLRQELGAGKAFSGRVVGPSGAPADAVPVWIDGWPVGKSNADGTFLVSHAPTGASVVVARTDALVATARMDAGPVTLTLQKGRTLTGVVRDARSRAPVAGATVTLVDKQAASTSVVSDERGRYRFASVLPGRYWASAARVGYAREAVTDYENQAIDLRRESSQTRNFALEPLSRLKGVVVDVQGRPVEGAFVSLLAKESPTLYVRRRDFGGGAGRTLEDGTFSLTYEPERRVTELPWPLLVLKDGYAATRVEKVEQGKGAGPLVVTLARGIALDGRVVAEDGSPVSDVEVVIAEDPGLHGGMVPVHAVLLRLPGEGWVKTGADGRFTARVGSGPHDLAFRKPGYIAKVVTDHDAASHEGLEVVLARAAGLRGSVVTAEGAGMPDVTVYVHQPSGTMASALSGEDGRFAVEDLSPGAYDLFAMKEGTGIRVMRQGELPAADLRIELPRLGALRGRVVDSKSGHPVATFAVATALSAAEWSGAEPQSFYDAAGQFVLRDIPVGEVSVSVRAEGYLPKDAPALVFADGEEAPPVEISLEPGVEVQGRVTTSTGQPLPDVRVSAAADGAEEEATVESDEEGRFRFPGLPRGTVTLDFQHAGYVSARRSFDTADTTRVDVALAPGLSLKGVVLSGGVGVPDAYVNASSSAADADDGSAKSGEGGTFTIEGLSPGRYTVTASNGDEGEARLENVEVEKAGLLRLVLERKPTAVLTGVVTGLPSGDATFTTRVMATGEDGGSGNAFVDSRGAFRMEKAPVGRVRVQAVAVTMAGGSRSSRAKDLTLEPGSESQAVLEFNDDVVISGRVTRDGSPASGGSIFFRASDGAGGMASARLDARGDYELVGVEPGPYSVTVAGMGFSYATEYLVRESAQFDIDATGASVKGQTVDAADGSPLSGVDVSLWREDDTKPTGSQTTGPKGQFVVRSLREGRYRVLTSKKGYGQQVREIQLESGASADVVLELVGSEGLTLTVVDARDDRPLDATVVVRDLAKRVIANQHSGVESDGSLNIPLAPGRYLLSTSAGGYGTATVPVSAPGRGLRVGLTPGGTLVVDSERDLRGRMRLVKPDGEEYVRCWCNGIAEIQLTGRHTKVENVTPGTYAIQLVDHAGVARTGPTVAIEEGRVATVTLE
jgi:hypothetical protein